MRKQNPIGDDVHVLKHYVPIPSYDTPEEIFEHYRQSWSMAMSRLDLERAKLPRYTCTYPETYKELQRNEQEARRMFDLAYLMVQSYRAACGNGTLIPVAGRHGQHADNIREIPLTHPGEIHLWTDKCNFKIFCQDPAHGYESAVNEIQHVTCRACLEKYYKGKRHGKSHRKLRAVV
jgi:hypothetical protein